MSMTNKDGFFVHNSYGQDFRVGDCVYPYGKTASLGKIVQLRLKRAPGQDKWAPHGEVAFVEEVRLVWLREGTRNRYGDDWMPSDMFKSMSHLIHDHERKAENFREQCEQLEDM